MIGFSKKLIGHVEGLSLDGVPSFKIMVLRKWVHLMMMMGARHLKHLWLHANLVFTRSTWTFSKVMVFSPWIKILQWNQCATMARWRVLVVTVVVGDGDVEICIVLGTMTKLDFLYCCGLLRIDTGYLQPTTYNYVSSPFRICAQWFHPSTSSCHPSTSVGLHFVSYQHFRDSQRTLCSHTGSQPRRLHCEPAWSSKVFRSKCGLAGEHVVIRLATACMCASVACVCFLHFLKWRWTKRWLKFKSISANAHCCRQLIIHNPFQRKRGCDIWFNSQWLSAHLFASTS